MYSENMNEMVHLCEKCFSVCNVSELQKNNDHCPKCNFEQSKVKSSIPYIRKTSQSQYNDEHNSSVVTRTIPANKSIVSNVIVENGSDEPVFHFIPEPTKEDTISELIVSEEKNTSQGIVSEADFAQVEPDFKASLSAAPPKKKNAFTPFSEPQEQPKPSHFESELISQSEHVSPIEHVSQEEPISPIEHTSPIEHSNTAKRKSPIPVNKFNDLGGLLKKKKTPKKSLKRKKAIANVN